MTFETFIESLDLRHFTPEEFLVSASRHGNSRPPRELWHNLALTATVLDRLRDEVGQPTRITSCYRAPTYNRSVGGTRRSQHQALTAVDFQVRDTSPEKVGEVLKLWRSAVTLFRIPVRVERVAYVSPAGPVPFGDVETWDRRDADGCMMRFAGGVGVYSSFVHLDTRGVNASWSGR